MKTKRVVLSLLLAPSLALTAAWPAFGASQDAFFWQELQRTDGVQERDLAAPPTRATAEVARRDAATGDWFEAERRKTDGYVAEQAAPESDAATANAMASPSRVLR